MKNVTRIIAVSFTCVFASCASDKSADPVVNEVEVVRVETGTPKNSTEVTLGKDGASLKTKDGDIGTKIEVKGGSTKIEVKGE